MGLRIKRRDKAKDRKVRSARVVPEAKVMQLFVKSVPDPLIERLRELAARHPQKPVENLPPARFMTDEQGIVTATKVRIALTADDQVRVVDAPLDDLTSYRLRN